MKVSSRFLISIFTTAVCALAAGCGSSGPSTPDNSTSGKAQGSVAVTVQFPPASAASRQYPGSGPGVPLGSRAVKVRILNVPTTGAAADLAQPQIVPAPAPGTNIAAAVTFTNIPAGPVQLIATAYTDANAATFPVGTATANTTVNANNNPAPASVTLTLVSTVNSITVSPTPAAPATSVPLTIGTPQTFTATVRDASGNILTGLGAALTWSSSNQIYATVSPATGDSTTVTPVLATPPGTIVNIEVREVNTGKFVDVPVTVNGS